MKTWYFRVALAVVWVFAVCRFNKTKTYFCAKVVFSGKNKTGFCDFSEYRLIWHPEHTPDFQSQYPLASPDPFSIKNRLDLLFSFSCGFVLFPYMESMESEVQYIS